MKFDEFTAYKRLKELAKHAPDLTGKSVINQERIHKMTLSSHSWKMVYATERVDDKICAELRNLADEADVMEKMYFVQNMEVMNYVNHYESEKRRVGHTAIRFPTPGKEWSKEVHEASHNQQIELEKLKHFLGKSSRFTTMVAIGIGGSYLGAKAVYEALKAYQKGPRKLFFSSNVDPDKAASILQEVDLEKTLILVISKSGGTLEISSQEAYYRLEFEKAGLNPKDHFVVVTEKGSPMDQPSRCLEVFYMWDYIGGRYSVSSMVGAVPIAFMLGMEVWSQFLKGLHDMDQHALKEKDPMKNLPLWGALLGIWNRNFLGYSTFGVVPYAQGMDFWSLHLQQLFMESNGKNVLKEDGSFASWKTCPVVWGTVGTEGQHSYFQCIHQGTDIIPLEFIGFCHSQMEKDALIQGSTNQEKLLANLFAQSLALAKGEKNKNHNKYFPGNRPSHILLADRLDPYTLGNLLAYHEHYVTFQGFIWGVNSFDQEGVQLGKVLATDILALMKEKREKGRLSSHKGDEAALALLEELDKVGKPKSAPKKKAA